DALPSDAKILPGPVNAAIGRCEIWPCRDAAIVLTYADKNPSTEVDIKGTVEMTVSQFMNEHDAFRYYDRQGKLEPFRLGIVQLEEGYLGYDPRIPKGDFSTRTIESTDIVGLAGTDNRITEVFRPAFTKLSIYGWKKILRQPRRDAIKEIRSAVVARNVLREAAWDFAGSNRVQELIATIDVQVAKLRSCLDGENSPTQTHALLKTHPELLHPALLAFFENIPLADGETADFVMIVQSEDVVECIVVKVGDTVSRYFEDATDITCVEGKDTLLRLKQSFELSQDTLPFAVAPDWVVRFESILGRSSTLTYAQRCSLRADEEEGLTFLTYDDLIGHVRYETYQVANIWDR